MLLSKILEELLWGMGTSIEIFLLTLLFSIPLGLAVAAGRMSSFKPLQWFMKAYISIMRGTPLMLQLIVVFFGPYYIFGMSLSRDFRMIAVIIAFTINYAAYFAEIFRGGIESIPNGQYEAAQAAIEEEKKNQLIEKYEKVIDEEEISKVRAEVSNFTYSELESKLAISFANKQMTTEENTVNVIPQPEPAVNEFALLIEKYRKN